MKQMAKENIRERTTEEIAAFLTAHGEKAFRAKQIGQWIWQRGAESFEEMTNLPKATREMLAEAFRFDRLTAERTQSASDGTTKTAWRTEDGEVVESVLIPGKGRHTVCVSSQAGCKLGCKFCATGASGFRRDLTAGEIFSQVAAAKREAESRGSSLSNIVFMGMGEPLLNYENVMRAIGRLTAEDGMGMSPYRITISTAGIPQGIRRLADEGTRCNLAVSLHAAKDAVRTSLMPVNQAYPLREVAESLKYFVEKTGTRPTFEYLLLRGINDSVEDAKALAAYCRQFPIKINVIEYNETGDGAFRRSTERSRDEFIRYLEGCHIVVNLRHSKGQDIDAACGQLAGKI